MAFVANGPISDQDLLSIFSVASDRRPRGFRNGVQNRQIRIPRFQRSFHHQISARDNLTAASTMNTRRQPKHLYHMEVYIKNHRQPESYQPAPIVQPHRCFMDEVHRDTCNHTLELTTTRDGETLMQKEPCCQNDSAKSKPNKNKPCDDEHAIHVLADCGHHSNNQYGDHRSGQESRASSSSSGEEDRKLNKENRTSAAQQ